MNINVLIKKLGIYRASYFASHLYISIVFRITIGVLCGQPADTMALMTSIELLLNFILEVPTGYISDRFGRIKTALVGATLHLISLCLVYYALFPNTPRDISRNLFILHGIIMGFVRPLMSGAIEGFYQSNIEKYADNSDQAKMLIRQSFTISQQYLKSLNFLAVLFSFSVLFVTYKTIGAQHAYLLGFIFWIITHINLYLDYRKYGDESVSEKVLQMGKLIDQFMNDRAVIFTCINASFLGLISGIAYIYLILSISKEGAFAVPNSQWILMISFMLGYSGLSQLLRGSILPKMIKKYSEKKIMIILLVFLSILSLFGLKLNMQNFYVLLFFVFFYGCIVDFCIMGVGNINRNIFMSRIDSNFYATGLSMLVMPSYLAIALYSFVLDINGGIATIHQILQVILCATVLAILNVQFNYRKKSN